MIRTLLASLAFSALVAAPALAAEVTLAPVSNSAAFADSLKKDYGVREGEILADRIERALTRALQAQGHEIVEDRAGAVRIAVTIEDAKPNRPTMEQLSRQPGLDFGRSLSIGGAKLTAVVTTPGEAPKSVTAEFYETDIRWVLGAETWSDANRAIQRLAREIAAAVPPAPPAPPAA